MHKIKTDEWIALFALFVSIFSIVISSKQFSDTSSNNSIQQQQAMRHNKLSVRPLLEFEIEYTKAASWTGVSLKNKGIGPAIIVELTKKYEDELILNWGDLTNFLVDSTQGFWLRETPFYVELKKGKALLPNDEIKLWYTDSNNVEDFIQASNILEKLRLEVKYTDIYNDTLTAKSW